MAEIIIQDSLIISFNALRVEMDKIDFKADERRVYDQALRHNIYIKDLQLLKDKRPNESDELKKYRDKNRRNFTKEIVTKLNTELVVTLSQTGIKYENLSDEVQSYIDDNYFGFEKIDFDPYFLTYVIPIGLIDPNAIMEAHVDGLVDGKKDIRTLIIHFNDYNHNTDVLIYKSPIVRGNYFIKDKINLYEAIRTKEGFRYEFVNEHNLGEIRVNYLPGSGSFTEDKRRYYRTSLISHTYEILDELICVHSDSQALNTKLNAILAIPKLKCNKCEGTKKIQSESGLIACPVCTGKGTAISQMDHFIIDTNTIENDKGKILIPEYINPDVNLGTYFDNLWRSYFADAKKSVGLDALIDKSESGEAMGQRLKPFESFVTYLASLAYSQTLTKYFYDLEDLYNVKKDGDNYPYVKVPQKIEVRTPELLLEKYTKAVGVQKIPAAIDYYNSVYANDQTNRFIMNIIVNKFPSTLYTGDEVEAFVNTGVFKRIDVTKGMRAYNVLSELSEDVSFQFDKKYIENKGAIIEEMNKRLDILVPELITSNEG